MSTESPVTPAEALLQAYVERPLNRAEQEELLTAAQQNPALADDAALFGLLRELRLERRIAKHEDAAWTAFSQLAVQRQSKTHAVQHKLAPWRWLGWPATVWGQLQSVMPAMAVVVIVVQMGGLVWLSSSHKVINHDAARGGTVQACPAVMARFKLGAEMTDVSRVLTQSQASIVSGPDATGMYRLQGPATFTQDARNLMQGVASETKPAPDCEAASR